MVDQSIHGHEMDAKAPLNAGKRQSGGAGEGVWIIASTVFGNLSYELGRGDQRLDIDDKEDDYE